MLGVDEDVELFNWKDLARSLPFVVILAGPGCGARMAKPSSAFITLFAIELVARHIPIGKRSLRQPLQPW